MVTNATTAAAIGEQVMPTWVDAGRVAVVQVQQRGVGIVVAELVEDAELAVVLGTNSRWSQTHV